MSWLRDQMGLIQSAEESEAIASSVSNTAGKQDVSLSSYLCSRNDMLCDISEPMHMMVHWLQSLDVGWQSRTMLACLSSALNTNHSTHFYMFPAECLPKCTCCLFRFSADRPITHLASLCGNKWHMQRRGKSPGCTGLPVNWHLSCCRCVFCASLWGLTSPSLEGGCPGCHCGPHLIHQQGSHCTSAPAGHLLAGKPAPTPP